MTDFLINTGDLGQEVPEIVPEGKQLFIVYNMWFGKFNNNPKGKRRSGDFILPLNVKFMHYETGLFLSRLDNGQPDPWNRMLFIKRLGNIDTRPNYIEFMQKIGVKPREAGGMISFHVKRDGKMVFTPYNDPEFPGPLGLPVKLMVIHKEEPVLVPKEGAEKDRWGRYAREDLVEQRDEDGNVVMKTVAYIQVTQPIDDSYRAKAEAGWPVLYELAEDEKKIRGEYYKPDVTDEEINAAEDIEEVDEVDF